MPLRRRDFAKGGTVLVVTRTGNGASVQQRKRRARVIDFNRGSCKIAWCDERARHVVIPFAQLEPDPDWIAERDAREAERRRRLDDARREAAAAASATTPADKQHERDEGGAERVEDHHDSDDRTPAAPEPSPLDQMPLDEVQAEIDRLEHEQSALIDMLIPIEDRLKALKRRRKALKPPMGTRLRACAAVGER